MQNQLRNRSDKRPTRADVAAIAGVNESTVSRAMTGSRLISQETRDRVLGIAEQIGYRPNVLARILANNHSRIIGIVVNALWPNQQMYMVHHAQIAAENCGYQTMICEARNQIEVQKAYMQRFIDLNVDGLIVVSIPGIEPVLEKLGESLPIVNMDSLINAKNISMVNIDNMESMYKLTNYLISLGHRHIALISGGTYDPLCFEREKGFHKALVNAGFDGTGHVAHAGSRADVSHEKTLQLLEKSPEITAVIGIGDTAVLGILGAAVEAGRQVPDSLSLASFDDTPVIREWSPPITCIAQAVDEIGTTAVQHIVERIENPKTPTKQIILPGKLIVRESCRKIS
jgi:DNA-binding LacI/PurR family transcriptional regulator